jgi:septum site-determining protein MinC
MPASENAVNRMSPNQKNGAEGEHAQEKLSALLDDVTVNLAQTAPKVTPATPITNSAVKPAGETPLSLRMQTLASRPKAENAPTEPNSASGGAADSKPNLGPLTTSPQVAQIAAQIKSMQSGATRPSTPGEMPGASQPTAVPSGAVNIKGRGDGIAIEIGKGNWPDLIHHLGERLTQAAGFFRGGRVALDVGARPLLENELAQLRELLVTYTMTLGVVRTSAERTFEAAIALGLAAKLETPHGETDAEIESAASNHLADHHFVYRGNLRSGQVLERNEHILIIGDVNPGAEVISTGDILVWGRLRGLVHAGAAGDTHSVVLALELAPIQLRIANLVADPNEAQSTKANGRWTWKRPAVQRPEIAYIAGDRVITEPWDDSKPGGLSAFRRTV